MKKVITWSMSNADIASALNACSVKNNIRVCNKVGQITEERVRSWRAGRASRDQNKELGGIPSYVIVAFDQWFVLPRGADGERIPHARFASNLLAKCREAAKQAMEEYPEADNGHKVAAQLLAMLGGQCA